MPTPQQTEPAQGLPERSQHRRAVETVIWAMPAVNFDRMNQAMSNVAGRAFNQIVYWSGLPDWKNQTLTPNLDAIYLLPFTNTRDAGPMVLEIPPADEGTINGTVMDCWQSAIEAFSPPFHRFWAEEQQPARRAHRLPSRSRTWVPACASAQGTSNSPIPGSVALIDCRTMSSLQLGS
jgi:hypothetical protein